jgi:hypothetical protein
MDDHDRLIALLNRLKLTALRDQLERSRAGINAGSICPSVWRAFPSCVI